MDYPITRLIVITGNWISYLLWPQCPNGICCQSTQSPPSALVFYCNIFCIFGEDVGTQEEELWFKLNFVSFGWESRRPLYFCALQLLHVVRFLALFEQALATSHINRWFQEWNMAMKSLIFLWFVCSRYLFWLFPQYKFEMQTFLKFYDATGSKFRSIAKRLCLEVIERGVMKLMRMYHLYSSNSSVSPFAF